MRVLPASRSLLVHRWLETRNPVTSIHRLRGWRRSITTAASTPPQRASITRLYCSPQQAPSSTPSQSSTDPSSPVPDAAAAATAATPSSATSADSMAATALLEESDWAHLGQHLAAYDEQREALIKRCRDIQKLSKQAVYSLHRGEVDRAAEQLKRAESLARELLPALQRYPALRPGSYSAALEEYAEAMAFAVFLREGRLVRSGEIPLAEPEEFLGGVLDFTGELNRYAIARATARDMAAVQRCRDLVDAIMGRFLQFDLRNGSLRKKYDALKYTLKKMESTLYELSLTAAMGFKVASEATAAEPEAGGEAVEEDG